MIKVKHELDLLPMVLKSRASGQESKAPLVIRITLNCKSTQVSLSTKVSPENWDVDLKEVSSSELGFKITNKKLKEAIVDLGRIYDQLFATSDCVTPSMIKSVYKGLTPLGQEEKKSAIIEPEPPLTLIGAFDEFILKFEKLVKIGERSAGTLRQWRSTRKKTIEFLQFTIKKKDIDFPQITPLFGDKLYEYLTIDANKIIGDATAKKHIKKVKQIIKAGVKLQIIKNNPIADFVCGGDTNDVIPLEFEQINAIYHKDFKIQRLQEVADAYIFQIFTGFAYQDLYNLRPENIILVGPSKERWLCKHRGKTGVYEIVPMLPVIEQLIEKYKSHPVCLHRNSLLPILSNTNFNGYLKEIATIAGIDRNLNTHLARHTFADIMLNLGMPLEDVSKMLGHKSIRTTQRYCKVRKERIQKNFNEFIRPVLSDISFLDSAMDQPDDNKHCDSEANLPSTQSASTSSSAINYSFSYTVKTA